MHEGACILIVITIIVFLLLGRVPLVALLKIQLLAFIDLGLDALLLCQLSFGVGGVVLWLLFIFI